LEFYSERLLAVKIVPMKNELLGWKIRGQIRNFHLQKIVRKSKESSRSLTNPSPKTHSTQAQTITPFISIHLSLHQ
jgi:hypothetical protein